jgi:hypothetical protein
LFVDDDEAENALAIQHEVNRMLTVLDDQIRSVRGRVNVGTDDLRKSMVAAMPKAKRLKK